MANYKSVKGKRVKLAISEETQLAKDRDAAIAHKIISDAKETLHSADYEASGILEEIILKQALTSTTIDAWITKRQNVKTQLGI